MNSSKIKNLHIPLPGFKKFFHKPSSEDETYDQFIGREDIAEQLGDWLKSGESGSYLVSGYRGMGKSSFVGKVLNGITDEAKLKRKIIIILYILFCISLIFTFTLIFGSININGCNVSLYKGFANCTTIFSISYWVCWSSLVLIILILWRPIMHWKLFSRLHVCKKRRIDFNKNAEKREWFRDVFNIPDKSRKKNRLVIKINLGHEILHERDILGLVAKRIYEQYFRYTHSIYCNGIWIGFKFVLFVTISFFCVYALSEILTVTPVLKRILDNSNWYGLIENGRYVTIIMIAKLLFVIPVFYLIKSLYNWLIRLLPALRRISHNFILKDLKHLTDRIDTTVSENQGPNTGYTSPSSIIGISLLRQKSKNYPMASVREIECELVSILERMQEAKRFPTMLLPPQFIVVFDELDKIDPENNYNTSSKETTPEFENTNNDFSGGMASRKRKQNVLKLLGNIKFFITSAKAKFVFISGRELYDAYLADLTDREYAISSVFNGAIYVDSFFGSSNSIKNIIDKTEEYICRHLLPQKWYKSEAKKEYERTQNSPTPKYLTPKLDLYKKYLDEVIGNEEEYEVYKEKVLVFLFQFVVYLAHISNGSPKKIALYFEQYITKYSWLYEKNPFNQEQKKWENKNLFWSIVWINFRIVLFSFTTMFERLVLRDVCAKRLLSLERRKTKFCLSFNAIDQENIGFIHYIAYPIITAIINNNSQYGDKLLVSASFLIDHIYKHHKGGFSRDNIEHVPEVLESYHMPELRSFINTIVAFLRQTHISSISSGVYAYKFRKKISDDILYHSKISEEVAAMFNFTLDESLSVKRHYYRQIEHYRNLYMQFYSSTISNKTDNNPYALPLIRLYEIVAEIHLQDDEYDDAILQFHNGLELIKNEWQWIKLDAEKLHLLLMMIKNVLKLGLVYECQHTYNLAYALYNELIHNLIDFRHVDETRLGLSYCYENNKKEKQWRQKELVFYHEFHDYPAWYYSNEQNKEKFLTEVFPNQIEEKDIQEKKVDYLLEGDDIISGLSYPLTPIKNNILAKLSIFEDVQFVYQTILAKLFVIEKIDLNGITQANLDVAENEFKYLYLMTNSKDKFMLAADFYRKLGAILFFKNFHSNDPVVVLKMWGYDIYSEINEFCRLKWNDIQQHQKPNQWIMKTIEDCVVTKWMRSKNFSFNSKERDTLIKDNCEKNEWESLINPFLNFTDKRYETLWESEKLDAMQKCHDHCTNRNNPEYYNHACYACNYYSNAMNIIINSLFDKKVTFNQSRIFEFILQLKELQKEHPLKSSYISLIASTLRGMADVQLSCAGSKSKNDSENTSNDSNTPEISCPIHETFITAFLKLVEQYRKEEVITLEELTKNTISHVEKAILYYWTSAAYFAKASSAKDTAECLGKILRIFNVYISLTDDTQPFKQNLEHIKTLIAERAIKYLYHEYDNANLIEIQQIKNILNVDYHDLIKLYKLSNFADIAELLYSYCTLEMRCEGEKKLYERCYDSPFMSKYRLSGSIYEKIHAFHFKAKMNENESQLLLHQTPGKYLECVMESIKNTDTRKLEEINFYIKDSLYCLIQIADTLSSFKMAQFSYGFLGDIYYDIYKWAKLYSWNKGIYPMYGADENAQKEQNDLFFNKLKNDKDFNEKDIAVIKSLQDNIKLSCIYSEKFEEEVIKEIGEGEKHYLVPNYAAAMAVKYYKKSLEVHTEGRAYREMLGNMYLLDDDINNANETFALALERYRINSGKTHKNIKELEDAYENATFYRIKSLII